MNNSKQMIVLNQIYDKWSEYFEHAGDQSPLLMNHILADMVIKERENTEFYKNLLKLRV